MSEQNGGAGRRPQSAVDTSRDDDTERRTPHLSARQTPQTPQTPHNPHQNRQEEISEGGTRQQRSHSTGNAPHPSNGDAPQPSNAQSAWNWPQWMGRTDQQPQEPQVNPQQPSRAGSQPNSQPSASSSRASLQQPNAPASSSPQRPNPMQSNSPANPQVTDDGRPDQCP